MPGGQGVRAATSPKACVHSSSHPAPLPLPGPPAAASLWRRQRPARRGASGGTPLPSPRSRLRRCARCARRWCPTTRAPGPHRCGCCRGCGVGMVLQHGPAAWASNKPRNGCLCSCAFTPQPARSHCVAPAARTLAPRRPWWSAPSWCGACWSRCSTPTPAPSSLRPLTLCEWPVQGQPGDASSAELWVHVMMGWSARRELIDVGYLTSSLHHPLFPSASLARPTLASSVQSGSAVPAATATATRRRRRRRRREKSWSAQVGGWGGGTEEKCRELADSTALLGRSSVSTTCVLHPPACLFSPCCTWLPPLQTRRGCATLLCAACCAWHVPMTASCPPACTLTWR